MCTGLKPPHSPTPSLSVQVGAQEKCCRLHTLSSRTTTNRQIDDNELPLISTIPVRFGRERDEKSVPGRFHVFRSSSLENRFSRQKCVICWNIPMKRTMNQCLLCHIEHMRRDAHPSLDRAHQYNTTDELLVASVCYLCSARKHVPVIHRRSVCLPFGVLFVNRNGGYD